MNGNSKIMSISIMHICELKPGKHLCRNNIEERLSVFSVHGSQRINWHRNKKKQQNIEYFI